MKLPVDYMEGKSVTGKNGLTLSYRFYKPDEETDKNYPLLIFLHGAGERGNDNLLHISIHNELLVQMFNNDKLPEAYIIAPQCPNEMKWVDVPWEKGNYVLSDTPQSKPSQVVMEIINMVRKKYNIDENRIYISGLSMGGFGTWDLIMRYPDIFAAAVPVCGGADTHEAEKIKHIPIQTFHAAFDPTVPVNGTREMVSKLKQLGADIQYTELKNSDHNSWTYAYTETNVIAWLFQIEKKKL